MDKAVRDYRFYSWHSANKFFKKLVDENDCNPSPIPIHVVFYETSPSITTYYRVVLIYDILQRDEVVGWVSNIRNLPSTDVIIDAVLEYSHYKRNFIRKRATIEKFANLGADCEKKN